MSFRYVTIDFCFLSTWYITWLGARHVRWNNDATDGKLFQPICCEMCIRCGRKIFESQLVFLIMVDLLVPRSILDSHMMYEIHIH